MRRILLAVALTMSAAPAVAGGAPDIRNACGSRVFHASVEIGGVDVSLSSFNPPWGQRTEYNNLGMFSGGAVAFCYRDKDDDHPLRVTLPDGLDHCLFDSGQLSCWIKSNQ